MSKKIGLLLALFGFILLILNAYDYMIMGRLLGLSIEIHAIMIIVGVVSLLTGFFIVTMEKK